MNPTIIKIGNKYFKLTIDSLGVKHLDGLTIDKWLGTIDTETKIILAEKGLNLAVTEPRKFENIVERIKMPKEQADLIRQAKEGVQAVYTAEAIVNDELSANES